MKTEEGMCLTSLAYCVLQVVLRAVSVVGDYLDFCERLDRGGKIGRKSRDRVARGFAECAIEVLYMRRSSMVRMAAFGNEDSDSVLPFSQVE